MVLTENNVSDKSSDTSNNLPLLPSIANKSVFPTDPDPNRINDPEGDWVKDELKFKELVNPITLAAGIILISAIFYNGGMGIVHSSVCSTVIISLYVYSEYSGSYTEGLPYTPASTT